MCLQSMFAGLAKGLKTATSSADNAVGSCRLGDFACGLQLWISLVDSSCRLQLLISLMDFTCGLHFTGSCCRMHSGPESLQRQPKSGKLIERLCSRIERQTPESEIQSSGPLAPTVFRAVSRCAQPRIAAVSETP